MAVLCEETLFEKNKKVVSAFLRQKILHEMTMLYYHMIRQHMIFEMIFSQEIQLVRVC